MRKNGKLFLDNVVVVTGSSAGLGRAVALAFARQGADVGLISRNEGRLASLQAEIESLGRRALMLPLDVADARAMESAVEKTEAELGPIDVFVNNAMTSVFSFTWDTSWDEYKRVTEVTYLGQVYGTLAALKVMRPRNKGRIIFVGSVLAYRGIPLQSAYCASKHAIQGFFDSLRSELLHDKSRIKICMVQLPAMNTPQFAWVKSRMKRKPMPVPPIYQPEVGAEAVLWGARLNRREITFGFRSAAYLWGNSLFPGAGDRYLAKTGVQSQLTDDREDPGRTFNLWHTVDGDFKSRWRFDGISRSKYLYFMAHVENLLWVLFLLAILIVALLVYL